MRRKSPRLTSRADAERRPENAPHILLEPDFRIIEASDAYRLATLLWNEEVRGLSMFDVFPDNPHNPAADGVIKLRDSLRMVLWNQVPHRMALQHYDVRDRVSSSQSWVEKFWLPVNTPVFARSGRKVIALVHQVRDVTRAIQLRRWIDELSVVLREQQATLRQMTEALRDRQADVAAAARNIDSLLKSEDAIAPSSIEAIERVVGTPKLREYFQPDDEAPMSAKYAVYHRRSCRLKTNQVFVEARQPFPRCLECGDDVHYRPVRRDRFPPANPYLLP